VVGERICAPVEIVSLRASHYSTPSREIRRFRISGRTARRVHPHHGQGFCRSSMSMTALTTDRPLQTGVFPLPTRCKTMKTGSRQKLVGPLTFLTSSSAWSEAVRQTSWLAGPRPVPGARNRKYIGRDGAHEQVFFCPFSTDRCSRACRVRGPCSMRLQPTPGPDNKKRRNPLKQLSLEQLGDVEVTTASKEPEEVWKTAAAIYVLTNEDIRRSGATQYSRSAAAGPRCTGEPNRQRPLGGWNTRILPTSFFKVDCW